MRRVLKGSSLLAIKNKDERLYLCTRSHLIHRSINKLAQLTGAMAVRLKAIVAKSPMVSASLFSKYNRHLLIREGAQMTSGTIRKFLNLTDSKDSAWLWNYAQQEARLLQYGLAIEDLQKQRKVLLAKLEVCPNDEIYHVELSKVDETVQKLGHIVQNMQPSLCGSMHPDPGASSIDSPAENGSQSMMVGPNSPWLFRGIMVRIAGAKKGQRAESWKRYAGSYSINSVDYVNAEESKEQILTKYGAYGLVVRMVRQLCTEMPRLDMPEPISRDGVHFYEPFKVFTNMRSNVAP